MIWIVVTVFVVVYLGMILGRIPGLALDRTGVALLGAIVLLATGTVEAGNLTNVIDIPTIALLFGLMVLSAQFRLAGTYSYIVRAVGEFELKPSQLLAVVIATTALLSSLLINDVVCLAMTPVVIEICIRRQLDPVPFLLGVACASNIGSAATLVGNPQNILVGQALDLSFSGYLLDSVVPVAVSLCLLWLVIVIQYKTRWRAEGNEIEIDIPEFSRWQTSKGGIIALIILALFLSGAWPRDLVALSGAGILLLSRRMRSREMLGIVDWQLLLLFASLFIVNFALRESSVLNSMQLSLQNAGVNLHSPNWLFVISAGLSNIVSNVPAVMLLLPFASHPSAGPILALASTLAGNLIVVGSIANIIVIEQAHRLGVNISWKRHAFTGIPVALLSLTVAGLWLWFRSL